MQLNLQASKRLLAACRKGILRTKTEGLIPGGTCLIQTNHIDEDGTLQCTSNLFEADLSGDPSLLQAQPVEIKFIDRANNLYLFVIGKLQQQVKGNGNSIELKISVSAGSAYRMEKAGGQINILQSMVIG